MYDYLVRRCGSAGLAEDLTSSTFVSAALAIERQTVDHPSVPWLITIARHKLVDHWRREAVARRSLELLAGLGAGPTAIPGTRSSTQSALAACSETSTPTTERRWCCVISTT